MKYFLTEIFCSLQAGVDCSVSSCMNLSVRLEETNLPLKNIFKFYTLSRFLHLKKKNRYTLLEITRSNFYFLKMKCLKKKY